MDFTKWRRHSLSFYRHKLSGKWSRYVVLPQFLIITRFSSVSCHIYICWELVYVWRTWIFRRARYLTKDFFVVKSTNIIRDWLSSEEVLNDHLLLRILHILWWHFSGVFCDLWALDYTSYIWRYIQGAQEINCTTGSPKGRYQSAYWQIGTRGFMYSGLGASEGGYSTW